MFKNYWLILLGLIVASMSSVSSMAQQKREHSASKSDGSVMRSHEHTARRSPKSVRFLDETDGAEGVDRSVQLYAHTQNRNVYAMIMIGEHCDPVVTERSVWQEIIKGTPISIPQCGSITPRNKPYVVASKKYHTINIPDAFRNSTYTQINEMYPESPDSPVPYKLLVWRQALMDAPTFCECRGQEMLNPNTQYTCRVGAVKNKIGRDTHKTRCSCSAVSRT